MKFSNYYVGIFVVGIVIGLFFISLSDQNIKNHYFGNSFFVNKLQVCSEYEYFGSSDVTENWKINGYVVKNNTRFCSFGYMKPDIDYFVDNIQEQGDSLKIRYFNYSCLVLPDMIENSTNNRNFWYAFLDGKYCSNKIFFEEII